MALARPDSVDGIHRVSLPATGSQAESSDSPAGPQLQPNDPSCPRAARACGTVIGEAAVTPAGAGPPDNPTARFTLPRSGAASTMKPGPDHLGIRPTSTRERAR